MNLCKIQGCNSPVHGRNLCQKHYLRWWRYKDTSFVKYHYQTNTPTYRSWNHMKQRCMNPNDDAYAHYYGRGITVCKRWLDFKNFYADMGDRPKGTELDRENNDGNYKPGNCRWVTKKVNANNRSYVNGRKLTLKKANEIRYLYPKKTRKELAKLYNITSTMVGYIINNKSWRNEI